MTSVPQLPPGLDLWGPELSELAPPAVDVLGPWLGPLEHALGEPVRTEADLTSFDGYEGLSRRGPYHRLLLSEWALADELPDEFLRRAVEKEHAFLQPAGERRKSHGVTVVLFDTGPSQWGCPRLVQLAVLIVLGRRAREAGGTLMWGALQAPAAGLHACRADDGLRAWHRQRSFNLVEDAHLEDWRGALAALPPAETIWLVTGSERLHLSTTNTLHVVDEDALGPSRRVQVTLTRPGRSPKRLLLGRPPHPAAASALLSPLKSATADANANANAHASPTSDGIRPSRSTPKLISPHAFRFSPGSTRLLMNLAGGTVRAIAVPHAPPPKGRDLRKKARFVEARAQHGVVVAALWKKGLVLVTRDERGIWLQRPGRWAPLQFAEAPASGAASAATPMPASKRAPAPASSAPPADNGRLRALVCRDSDRRYLFDQGDGYVDTLDPVAATKTRSRERYVDLLPLSGRLLVLTQRGEVPAGVVKVYDEPAPELSSLSPSAFQILHRDTVATRPDVLALDENGDTVWIRHVSEAQLNPRHVKHLLLPAGLTVLGAALRRHAWALAQDRKSLLLLSSSSPEDGRVTTTPLLTFNRPIAHATVNDNGTLCALLEQDALRVVDSYGRVTFQQTVEIA